MESSWCQTHKINFVILLDKRQSIGFSISAFLGWDTKPIVCTFSHLSNEDGTGAYLGLNECKYVRDSSSSTCQISQCHNKHLILFNPHKVVIN